MWNWLIVTTITIVALIAVIAQPQCSQLDAEVLILGAGMSGMNAARTLYDRGVTDFIIIEGKPEIGGRIMQASLRPGGSKVEIGANWMHEFDPNHPELHPLYALAQSCGGIEGSVSNFSSTVVYNSAGDIVSDQLDYERITAAYENVESISLSRQANGESDITVREALLESNWIVVSDEDKFSSSLSIYLTQSHHKTLPYSNRTLHLILNSVAIQEISL